VTVVSPAVHFFYYVGSAIAGPVGGIAYSAAAWGGATLYCAGLLAVALISATTLVVRRPAPVARATSSA
jgi:hypothetical protein